MPIDDQTAPPIRVMLVDDHRMILEVFALFLADTAEMQVTTAESFDEAAELLQSQDPFDVILLDLHMPGMNGVAGLRRAIRLSGGCPVAIITGTPTPRMQDEIMRAGASGIVLKTTPLRSLANAIRFMRSGERYLPMELMRLQSSDQRAPRPGQLSDKEMDVLNFLAAGKPNKEIAKELRLAEPTVKMHVTSIYRKFDVQNRTQAVVVARDMGLV